MNQKPKRMTQQDHAEEANWEGRFAAIEREADAILAAEGPNNVRGIYFVLEADAYMARMVEAERRVAQRDESIDRYIAKTRGAKPDADRQGPIVEMAVVGDEAPDPADASNG